jgi:hypothetical protein
LIRKQKGNGKVSSSGRENWKCKPIPIPYFKSGKQEANICYATGKTIFVKRVIWPLKTKI